MFLTRVVKLWVLVAGSTFCFLSVMANEVEVVNRTDLFGSGANNKPKKIGVATPGQRYKVVGQKGNWTAINFNGKSVWILAKNVKPIGADSSNERTPSSMGEAGGVSHSAISVHADLGLQTGGMGIAPGIGGNYKITNFSPKLRLDIGPSLFFFPSAGSAITTTSSVSAIEVLINGRLMYSVAPKMELGGEFGFIFVNSSTSTTATTVPAVSVSSSTLGMNLGGVFTYEFAQAWHGLANVRMVFAGGSSALVTAGVEYSF